MSHQPRLLMPIRNRIVVLALVAVLFLSGPRFTPAQAPASSPTLRKISRLVDVSVVVEDKNGNPVTDLTREDFTISDRGQPQQIQLFSMVSTAELPGITPLPPNTFTNRTPQRGNVPGSISVILIDAAN